MTGTLFRLTTSLGGFLDLSLHSHDIFEKGELVLTLADELQLMQWNYMSKQIYSVLPVLSSRGVRWFVFFKGVRTVPSEYMEKVSP